MFAGRLERSHNGGGGVGVRAGGDGGAGGPCTWLTSEKREVGRGRRGQGGLEAERFSAATGQVDMEVGGGDTRGGDGRWNGQGRGSWRSRCSGFENGAFTTAGEGTSWECGGKRGAWGKGGVFGCLVDGGKEGLTGQPVGLVVRRKCGEVD